MTQPPIDEHDIISEIPRCFPELNTGVIFYNNNKKNDGLFKQLVGCVFK